MGKGSRWKRWSLTWLVSRSPREPFAFILRPSFAAPFVWEHQGSGHTWTMMVISASTLYWLCFLTRRIIGKYFKDSWGKRWKKCDCGPKWLSSIRLPRMPWFLTPNWKRVEGQQRNGLKFFQVFGGWCVLAPADFNIRLQQWAVYTCYNTPSKPSLKTWFEHIIDFERRWIWW